MRFGPLAILKKEHPDDKKLEQISIITVLMISGWLSKLTITKTF